MVSDGTTVSVGQSNRGGLIDAKRLPDRGPGFVARPLWIERGYRFGTDELIALVTNVARRMSSGASDVRLVVADLSARTGGRSVLRFHRSHQSGRDVDLLFYTRDAEGRPVEAGEMRVFDANGNATDGSGFTVDVPRTWQLVKQLVTAPEAAVQFIFMYEPISALVLEHAARIGEPQLVIARARTALYQPGRRAPHDDHMHVRVYCSSEDRRYGCVDTGPMELLEARDAETQTLDNLLSAEARRAFDDGVRKSIDQLLSKGGRHHSDAASAWSASASGSIARAPVPAAARR